ncbi:hypothetical protein CVS40_6654 [Lucilia cuprina]|nr:hypothetical protein CVS40_6654 [Lucilia cuprina]
MLKSFSKYFTVTAAVGGKYTPAVKVFIGSASSESTRTLMNPGDATYGTSHWLDPRLSIILRRNH